MTQTSLPPPTALTLNDGSIADLYVMSSFVLEETATLTLGGTRPVVFVVLGTADIQGKLLLGGGEPGASPGGSPALTNPPMGPSRPPTA